MLGCYPDGRSFQQRKLYATFRSYAGHPRSSPSSFNTRKKHVIRRAVFSLSVAGRYDGHWATRHDIATQTGTSGVSPDHLQATHAANPRRPRPFWRVRVDGKNLQYQYLRVAERDGFEPSVPLAINAVGGTVCRGSAQPCHAYPQVGTGAVRSFRPRSGSCRPNRLLLTIGRMHSTRFGARAEEVERIGPIDIFHDGTHGV